MGKKQKLKQQRKLEQQVQAEIKKGKRKKTIYIITGIIVLLILAVFGWHALKSRNAATNTETQKHEYATIKTARGDIKLELFPVNAPKTVANFEKLAQEGFYNGTAFHRVVPGFVIQGGDPNTKEGGDVSKIGTGGPGYTFEDEINPKSLGLNETQIADLTKQGYKYRDDLTSLPNAVGAIAMANSGPDTNGSQFFIITDQDQPHLNGKHTVFGKVVSGMDIVKKVQERDGVFSVTIEK